MHIATLRRYVQSARRRVAISRLQPPIRSFCGDYNRPLDPGENQATGAAICGRYVAMSGSNRKGILVNIFGGIAKCDTIAEALIAAAREIGFKLPVVVRLEGTNVDRARKLLEQANIEALIPAEDLTDAAKKVCAQVA